MHFLEESCNVLLCALISDIGVAFPSVATSSLASQAISPSFGEETLLVMELLQCEGDIVFLLPSHDPLQPSADWDLSECFSLDVKLGLTIFKFISLCVCGFFCVSVPLHMRHPLIVYVTNNHLLPN